MKIGAKMNCRMESWSSKTTRNGDPKLRNNQIVIFRRYKNKIEVIGQALPHVPSNKSIVKDLETFKIEFEPDCPGLNFESLYFAKYLIIEIHPYFRYETLRLPPFHSNKLHKIFSAKTVFNLYEN